MQTTRDTLGAILDTLNEGTWTKGSLSLGGRCCLVGQPAYELLCLSARTLFPRRSYGRGMNHAISMNDHPDTTCADVRLVVSHAMAMARRPELAGQPA